MWEHEPIDVAALLCEIYGRIPPLARHAAEGLDTEQLCAAPGPGINPIGWLIWHSARVQDHHVGELLDRPQLWVEGGWAGRFGLDPDPDDIGYGHTADDVARVRPQGTDALFGYLDAVDARTRTMLQDLRPDDLDKVVDRRWDPPVTLGVRLVSVADDGLQHVGQAAYLRGLLGF